MDKFDLPLQQVPPSLSTHSIFLTLIWLDWHPICAGRRRPERDAIPSGTRWYTPWIGAFPRYCGYGTLQSSWTIDRRAAYQDSHWGYKPTNWSTRWESNASTTTRINFLPIQETWKFCLRIQRSVASPRTIDEPKIDRDTDLNLQSTSLMFIISAD